MSQPSLLEQMTQLLKRPIDDIKPLGGGCSYPSFVVSSRAVRFFVKTNASGDDVFLAEAAGLRSLQQYSSLIPELILANPHYLVLEFIDPIPPEKKFWQKLAMELGKLHQQKGESFGAKADNFIGLSQQKNSWDQGMKWSDFFWNFRIHFKLKQLAEQGSLSLSEDDISKLKKVSHDLLDESPCHPSPLHGDLWSGNIICGKAQRPFLIDPAFYYGDREADLAMTECFGGFHAEFYQTYSTEYPLSHGYLMRKHLYNLYHMLNHQLIFGSSYQTTVHKIVDQLLAQ